MINFFVPFLLIMLQAIFTATETAVLSIEKSTLGKARGEKKLWAIRTTNFLKSPARFFATILVCEGLILVAASTLFAHFFITHLGNQGVVFSTILLSFFSLTIGQYIPKSIALASPKKTMMLLSEIIYLMEMLFWPLVYIFSKISRGIAHIFMASTKTDLIRHSDIIFAMSEYEKESSKLVSRLFNFSRSTIGQVMIPLAAAFLCKKGSESNILRKKTGHLYTRIPVYESRRANIVGILDIKDYFYNEQIKLRPPFFVNINDRCMAIFRRMKAKGEHLAIVQDESDKVVGIVALEDLIEELVGEIRAER